MKKILLALTPFIILSADLNQKLIDELIQKSNGSSIDQIRLQTLELEKDLHDIRSNFDPKLNLNYSYNKTKEKPINSFIPVFSPQQQYGVKLSKNLKYGFSVAAELGVDSRSATSSQSKFHSINTIGYGVEFGFDLWKDFLGRMSQRQLENINLSHKQIELKKNLDLHSLKMKLRSLYWSLVGNQEKTIISKRLYQKSLKQYEDIKKREKESVADKADVARSASFVSQRKGQILFLKYEKQKLLQSLRSMLPSLNGKEITLAPYQLQKSINEVLRCNSFIKKEKKTPFQFTDYDELQAYLGKIKSNQSRIDIAQSGIDVKLRTKFKRVGVGANPQLDGSSRGSFDKAMDDLSDNVRDGFEAGLFVEIPFGKSTKRLSEVNRELNQKRLGLQSSGISERLDMTHKQMGELLLVLQDVLKAQKENSYSLSVRLKQMRKKFNQARLPLYALLQDEDALLSNELSLVDTKLQILNTLIDYLVVFNKTPCNMELI